MKTALMTALSLTALAIVSAATASDPAQTARFVTDSRSGYAERGTSAQRIVTDARDRRSGTSGDAGYLLVSDGRGGYAHRSASGRPFLTDARGRYGGGSLVTAAAASASGQFDWMDAGIGGVAALFLAALGGGALLIVHRRRRPAFIGE